MKSDKHIQDSIPTGPDLELIDSPLRLRGGQDVASLVPYLLGFHPQDSIVALVCVDGRLFMTARMPLGMADHPLEFDDQIRRIADRQPLPEYRIDIRSDGRQELAILSRDPSKPKRPRRGFKPQLLPGGR